MKSVTGELPTARAFLDGILGNTQDLRKGFDGENVGQFELAIHFDGHLHLLVEVSMPYLGSELFTLTDVYVKTLSHLFHEFAMKHPNPERNPEQSSNPEWNLERQQAPTRMMNPESPRAVIYGRVSTNRQDISIEVQTEKCRLHCQLRDYALVGEFFDNGVSGKSLCRPEFTKIKEMVERKEIDVIVVYKLDRLSRNVGDLSGLVEMLNAKGITLVSISENVDTMSSSGRLFLNILGSMSQFERESIVGRVTDALRQLKESGRKYTRITPYGWACVEGQYVESPEEQAVLARLLDLRHKDVTYKEIVEVFNREQVPSRGGGPWSIRTVSSLYYKHFKTSKAEPIRRVA